jgi:hypothetical protein
VGKQTCSPGHCVGCQLSVAVGRRLSGLAKFFARPRLVRLARTDDKLLERWSGRSGGGGHGMKGRIATAHPEAPSNKDSPALLSRNPRAGYKIITTINLELFSEGLQRRSKLRPDGSRVSSDVLVLVGGVGRRCWSVGGVGRRCWSAVRTR